MASVFYEVMGMNYVLPVAECDLNITSKQQYGLISGVWLIGTECYRKFNIKIALMLMNLRYDLSFTYMGTNK